MPKPLRVAVRARVLSPIHKFSGAEFPGSSPFLPDQIWEFPFRGGLVLARPDLPQLFILNETAALVWHWSRASVPYSSMVDRFCQEYGLSREQAEADLSAVLSSWNEHLLVPRDSGDAAGSSISHPPDSWESAGDYLVNHRRVRIWVGDPLLSSEVSPRLEALHASPNDDPDLEFQIWMAEGRFHLAQNGNLISSEENPNALRAILLQEMVRRTEKGREWLCILHAGACGNDDSCVLVAGKSHSGKTTLCAALMASGMKFYCDDSAAIGESDGKVSPMPFRLMVRQGSWDVLRPQFPEIISSSVLERCGQKVRFLTPRPEQVATSAGLAKALLFVSFSPGERTTLRPLLPFETLLKLQESGFWVKHERTSIDGFLRWLESLPAFTFAYSDLAQAVSIIREMSDR